MDSRCNTLICLLRMRVYLLWCFHCHTHSIRIHHMKLVNEFSCRICYAVHINVRVCMVYLYLYCNFCVSLNLSGKNRWFNHIRIKAIRKRPCTLPLYRKCWYDFVSIIVFIRLTHNIFSTTTYHNNKHVGVCVRHTVNDTHIERSLCSLTP